MANTFLYFAYGSNLFAKRIHLCNPTAIMKDIGYIKNFRLDFHRYSKHWHGTSATIVETEHSVVWGVVWELDKCNLATLDCQEGVQDNIYRAMSVNVETPNGRTLNCRVYQQCNNPKEYIKPENFPVDKRPSPLYLSTILRGAEENNLPTDYIKFLKTIPDNGYEGKYDIRVDRRDPWRPLVEGAFLYTKITVKILAESRFNCDIRNQKRLLKARVILKKKKAK